MTDCSWDSDWPWPTSSDHRRGTDQNTYSSEQPVKFHLSAMPGEIYAATEKLLWRGSRTEILDIKVCPFLFDTQVTQAYLHHEHSMAALSFSPSDIHQAFTASLFKQCHSCGSLGKSELKKQWCTLGQLFKNRSYWCTMDRYVCLVLGITEKALNWSALSPCASYLPSFKHPS